MTTIIICAMIILYVIFVIVSRIRKIKKGQFCFCGCKDCRNCKGDKNK